VVDRRGPNLNVEMKLVPTQGPAVAYSFFMDEDGNVQDAFRGPAGGVGAPVPVRGGVSLGELHRDILARELGSEAPQVRDPPTSADEARAAKAEFEIGGAPVECVRLSGAEGGPAEDVLASRANWHVSNLPGGFPSRVRCRQFDFPFGAHFGFVLEDSSRKLERIGNDWARALFTEGRTAFGPLAYWKDAEPGSGIGDWIGPLWGARPGQWLQFASEEGIQGVEWNEEFAVVAASAGRLVLEWRQWSRREGEAARGIVIAFEVATAGRVLKEYVGPCGGRGRAVPPAPEKPASAPSGAIPEKRTETGDYPFPRFAFADLESLGIDMRESAVKGDHQVPAGRLHAIRLLFDRWGSAEVPPLRFGRRYIEDGGRVLVRRGDFCAPQLLID
jgi:hypothetical protein